MKHFRYFLGEQVYAASPFFGRHVPHVQMRTKDGAAGEQIARERLAEAILKGWVSMQIVEAFDDGLDSEAEVCVLELSPTDRVVSDVK